MNRTRVDWMAPLVVHLAHLRHNLEGERRPDEGESVLQQAETIRRNLRLFIAWLAELPACPGDGEKSMDKLLDLIKEVIESRHDGTSPGHSLEVLKGNLSSLLSESSSLLLSSVSAERIEQRTQHGHH
jgi:hypothetical protein